MKKSFITVATALLLATSLSLNSCIGSFSLTNKLLSWNQQISSKFVNEIVFLAFWILPVYEVSSLADVLVLNTIEFWSGSSPVAKSKTIIDGQDGKYLVERDSKGYTITSQNDGSVTRLNYDSKEQTWTLAGKNGEEYPLVTFIDETHVMAPAVNGEMQMVELTAPGVYAYQTAAL